MIDALSLSHAVGSKTILDQVSLQARPGEILSILGPNGAGKSTLLKCLAGYIRPTRGQVRLDGRPIQDIDLSELARRRAVLTQQIALNFPFTALEIAAMGRTALAGNEPPSNALAIAREALSLTEVSHLADRPISSLSGGEQQRVHMARVLAQLWGQESACLLLDEPTSALDLKHQFRLFDLCRSLCDKRGFAVVVILHDLALARRVSDQTLLLRGGQAFACGSSASVITPQAISDLYEIHSSQVMI
ncbi:heme ABC transporter ATP-binding protein [Sneathiella chinensis]|uniref:Hemin import ATP-binding protein HmuV n=1 Tax=Sneathiella chinensis TaxID=349750 RepID=A0ABQ5TYE1_9PROT|nr:heme ABC transporter ATP-binding protein [Sneathiella chinensis]GLQ04789.1 hemin import ATP-binding protein HmuV [Sneathiella chinensis]